MYTSEAVHITFETKLGQYEFKINYFHINYFYRKVVSPAEDSAGGKFSAVFG